MAFNFFLVNYSCSLESIVINLINYSHFGSCPRSKDFGVGKVNVHETTKEETSIIDEHV